MIKNKEKIIDDISEIIETINEEDSYQKLIELKRNIVDIEPFDTEDKDAYNKRILIKNFLYNYILKKEKTLNLNNYIKINCKDYFKNNPCDSLQLDNFNKKLKCFNRNIGNIPYIFISNAKNKAEASQNIYELFSKYATKLNYSHKVGEDIFFEEIKNEFEFELSKITNHDVRLEYVGSGAYGNCHKLIIADKIFCYKVFLPLGIYETKQIHGIHIEPQMALYLGNNGPKNRFVKFFFGKVTSSLDRDGFIITEFLVGKNTNQTHQKPLLEHLSPSINEENKPGNKIANKIVDFGGLIENVPEFRDKKIRKFVRIIAENVHHNYDNLTFKSVWKIKEKNIKLLKKIFSQNDKIYCNAVKVLKKYCNMFSDDLYKYLLDIKNYDSDSDINIVEYLQTSDIISTEMSAVLKNIEYFAFDIKTRTTANELSSDEGYTIIDLKNNIQAVYFTDIDDLINEVRIEKKENDRFITLFEITKDAILDLKEQNLCNLLMQ